MAWIGNEIDTLRIYPDTVYVCTYSRTAGAGINLPAVLRMRIIGGIYLIGAQFRACALNSLGPAGHRSVG